MESIRRASRFIVPDEVDIEKFYLGLFLLLIALVIFVVEFVEGFVWWSTTIGVLCVLVGLWGMTRRRSVFRV
jgi:membrane-bound ClpP family serine protease